MKKHHILIPLLLLACLMGLFNTTLHAQSFQWSRSAGSSTASSISQSYPTKIFRDSKDNIYYCLSFAYSSHVTIEGREVFRPRCNVEECCAVVCYDCEGNMKWYRTIFCHSYNTTGSSVSFRTVEMIEDTLVMSFNGIFQTLYLCDSTHVLDTMPVDEKTYALWMRTDNGRAIRTAYLGEPMSMVYSDNKLHLVGLPCMDDTLPNQNPDSCYVYLSTPQGERFRHFALDFRYNKFPSVYFELAVYHNKYYFLYNNDWESDSLWFGDQLHVDNTSGGSTNTVFACFDSTGQCLWSRLLNAFTENLYYGASHIAIDESTGLIYITASGHGYDPAYPDWNYNTFDGDTLWGADINARQGINKLVLACYDTLGNKQWVKYTHGPGNMNCIGMNLLPGRKLAMGGHTDGDAILDGMHTNLRDVERASYFAIYDLVKDSFVLLQTVQIDGYDGSYPYIFNTDKDGNLLFAGFIDEGNYVVCGSDTLYGSSPRTHVYYGRYGWPCDSAAHWPGPPQYALSLSVNNAAMGSVSGAGSYAGGSQVPISATPFDGHAFDHWSDGSTDNPRTILLVSDSAITAHFVKSHTEPEGIALPEQPRLTLFPNPATNEVTLLGLAEQPLSAEILDMTGRLAATFRNTTRFDLTALPQGAYILSIQTPTTKHHLRLVKK